MIERSKMRVLTSDDAVPGELQGAVIALGNFDGVHRGHQSVLSRGVAIAREHGASFGVMTFDPHPRVYFKPTTQLFTLSPLDRKLELLAAFGIDFTSVLNFDGDLAALTAEDFVDEIICRQWQANHVIVGYNFFFGKGRGGSPQLLQELGAKRGFGVTVIEPASDDGEVFSSSSVRDLLRVGNVREAAEVLGHWWTITGSVERGAGRGTGMGYPTVNVMLEAGQALHHGIYASRVWVDGHRFDGAAYNGRRPTFDNGIAKLEVFLFDFNESLYGHRIDVELIDFIRPDEAFESAEALMAQMDKDCAKARDTLKEINSADPMLNYPIGKAIAASITTARA
ncbi:MAG: bifunctional riboflavin kinase/FAD synthetase [Pseudomonadota bacterium]